MRSGQGGGACLEELEGSANVVKAASVAWRPLTHDAKRWFCELDWMLTAFVSDTTMALVEDGEVLGSRQLDMGNSGLIPQEDVHKDPGFKPKELSIKIEPPSWILSYE